MLNRARSLDPTQGEQQAPSRSRAQLFGIPDGPEGVRVTLELMRRLVRQWRTHPELRQLAENIVAGVRAKDFAGEARRLFEFVRDSIRYTQDINEVETLKTPDVLLHSRQGDCDDMSLLLAALLESLGHPARFVAVGFEPEEFEHVYVETKIGPQWIALDPSEPVEMGWSPYNGDAPILSRMVWHI